MTIELMCRNANILNPSNNSYEIKDVYHNLVKGHLEVYTGNVTNQVHIHNPENSEFIIA